MFTFAGGRKVNNITSLTVLNNTTLTIDVSPPAGRRWMVLSMKVVNPDNVARNVSVVHYAEAAKTNVIKYLSNTATAAGNPFQVWPSAWNLAACPAFLSGFGPMLIVENPEVLEVSLVAGGASAGGVDADGLVIEVLELQVVE